MTGENYPHIARAEHRLGLHYSRFRNFAPAQSRTYQPKISRTQDESAKLGQARSREKAGKFSSPAAARGEARISA
jgi:hypothetical protein